MKLFRLKFIPVLFIFSLRFFTGCEKENTPLVFSEIDLVKFSREHKGFNLLGKYDIGWSNNGFSEEEFEIVKDLGFNFVRLPIDYRTFIRAGNWDVIDEEKIAELTYNNSVRLFNL